MQRIISQTPVRISLFGGGTDYPAYYKRKKGATLGMTIDKYTYVSLGTISPFFDYHVRVSYSKIELVQNQDEIEHPSVRNCLKYMNYSQPLDIHISADLPARTGLGSSSSFTVGFLHALHALRGARISKQRLAEEACHIEQEIIKENVGSQDQFHAAFGGLNIFEFDASGVSVRPLIADAHKKQSLASHLLVFYTGMTRFATEVLQEQIEKTNKLENDLYLEKIYDMTFEAEDLFSNASDKELPRLLGKKLHESWELKKNLSSKISNPLIDQYYETALNCGAYGGKLCGAGGGGFLIFLSPKESADKIRKELNKLSEVNCSLESKGSRIIYMKE